MAVKNTSYTLADILGEPITEQEALALIKQATDSDKMCIRDRFCVIINSGTDCISDFAEVLLSLIHI